MPNYTQNLNLEKPLVNENYNIEVFNNNADKLDTAIKEVSSKVDNFEAPVKSVNNKTGAINLVAADIKTVDGKTLEEFKTTTSSQLDTLGKFDVIYYSEYLSGTYGVISINNIDMTKYSYLRLLRGDSHATQTIGINGVDYAFGKTGSQDMRLDYGLDIYISKKKVVANIDSFDSANSDNLSKYIRSFDIPEKNTMNLSVFKGTNDTSGLILIGVR